MAEVGEKNSIDKERKSLTEKVTQVREANRKYAKKVKELEGNLQNLEVMRQTYDHKTKALEEEVASYSRPHEEEEIQLASAADSSDSSTTDSLASDYSSTEETSEQVLDREAKTLDLLSRIDAFSEQDEKLRLDAARAHYNMGNIYFERGEYEVAAREYYQAVTLMPDDPDSHYNLAFVSSEYLHDQTTALKHYQIYLYLKPGAKDAKLIKEKILQAQLSLKTVIDSPLEEKYRNEP